MNNGKPRRALAGMILAAGYGERMLPLTSKIPKVLLPVLGAPILDIIAGKLARAGCVEIHCNLFHLADPIESFAARMATPVRVHRETELLGTGGGIGNMADSVKGFDAVILHNGDIVSDVDFGPVVSFHESRGALITLILVHAGPRANVLVEKGEVIGILDGAGQVGASAKPQGPGPAGASAGPRGPGPARRGVSMLGHTGLAILSPEAFDFFPRGKRASLIPILREMIRTRPGSVAGYDASDASRAAWGEIGSPAGYLEIHRKILIDKVRFDPLLEPPTLSLHVGPGAAIDPGARWKGFLEIGTRAIVRSGAALENCVLLEGAVVEGGEHREEIIFDAGVLAAEEPRT